MRKIIPKFGRVGIILAVTSMSILLSVLICRAVLTFYDTSDETDYLVSLVSVITPALVAPLVTWYLIGVLVKLHELEEKQRTLATYDELTGAMNRRAFFENFETLKTISDPKHGHLTLAYIDIDDFKAINDNYGHIAGDAVLKSFVQTLKDCARGSDLIARMGGEEFALLLPDTDIQGAHVILDRLRAQISKHTLKIEGHFINLSISIGLSHSPKEGEIEVEQLIKQADEALYQAKSDGKNCIVQYT